MTTSSPAIHLGAPQNILDEDHLRALGIIARNPAIHLFDLADGPRASSFAAHRDHVTELASTLKAGDLLTVIQPARKGFWSTEWTVAGYAAARTVARRRAALGRTVLTAVEGMNQHPSHHDSHFFRPEEGIFGRLRRP